MRTSTLLSAFVCLAAVASIASAGSQHDFSFDPNAIIDRYAASAGDGVSPGQTRADQPECRRLVGVGPGGNISTYNRGGGGQAEYNSYVNWTQSLGPGEGIRAFALWLAPAWGYTTNFGMTLGYSPQIVDNYPTTVNNAVKAVRAADGWTGQALYSGPYGPILYWQTNDPSKYLRPGGADIGEFGFSADTAVYNDAAYVGEVQQGAMYRVFFWSIASDLSDFGQDEIIADGNGFGGLTPNQGTFSLDAIDGWQLYAFTDLETVPEPVTMTLIGLGIAGLGGYIRRRGKASAN